jgi:hypothetical protein
MTNERDNLHRVHDIDIALQTRLSLPQVQHTIQTGNRHGYSHSNTLRSSFCFLLSFSCTRHTPMPPMLPPTADAYRFSLHFPLSHALGAISLLALLYCTEPSAGVCVQDADALCTQTRADPQRQTEALGSNSKHPHTHVSDAQMNA